LEEELEEDIAEARAAAELERERRDRETVAWESRHEIIKMSKAEPPTGLGASDGKKGADDGVWVAHMVPLCHAGLDDEKFLSEEQAAIRRKQQTPERRRSAFHRPGSAQGSPEPVPAIDTSARLSPPEIVPVPWKSRAEGNVVAAPSSLADARTGIAVGTPAGDDDSGDDVSPDSTDDEEEGVWKVETEKAEVLAMRRMQQEIEPAEAPMDDEERTQLKDLLQMRLKQLREFAQYCGASKAEILEAMESDDPKEALAKIVMEAEKTTDVKERLLKEIQEQFDEMMATEMAQKKKARQRRIGS